MIAEVAVSRRYPKWPMEVTLKKSLKFTQVNCIKNSVQLRQRYGSINKLAWPSFNNCWTPHEEVELHMLVLELWAGKGSDFHWAPQGDPSLPHSIFLVVLCGWQPLVPHWRGKQDGGGCGFFKEKLILYLTSDKGGWHANEIAVHPTSSRGWLRGCRSTVPNISLLIPKKLARPWGFQWSWHQSLETWIWLASYSTECCC